jgi:hypothetical protein
LGHYGVAAFWKPHEYCVREPGTPEFREKWPIFEPFLHGFSTVPPVTDFGANRYNR